MRRRTLLLGAGVAGAAAATGVGFWKWQEITPTLRYPGRATGHALRDGKLPAWSGDLPTIDTDVLIAGSGIAGLTAAWRLAKEGRARFAMVAGPERGGNAASGSATIGTQALRYPTGAHYLPLPSMESTHVRAILEDFGVLVAGAATREPTFDEAVLVHAPDERLYRDGRWQEGLVPLGDEMPGIGTSRRHEVRDRARTRTPFSTIERFFQFIDGLLEQRGADGRKVFAIPLVLSSTDPQWTVLDTMPFSAWLAREGYDDPALLWYLDYCCRDDYGANASRISAWSGLHYFASRNGRAANAERGAVLTWPQGLAALADTFFARTFDGPTDPRLLDGTVVSLRDTRDGVEALCIGGASAAPYVVRARRAICAMPLFVAKHVVAPLKADGYDPARHAPVVAPWLVANFALRRHPEEAEGAELAWDNVAYGSDGLGYVVSTHQEIRVAPSEATVFTAYRALADRAPDDARRWLDTASPGEVGDLAAAELRDIYGWRFAACVDRVDITLRGHAMASPSPGFLSNAGLRALREADGKILYAHSDLSGFSIFEEASWWGWQAAERILGR